MAIDGKILGKVLREARAQMRTNKLVVEEAVSRAVKYFGVGPAYYQAALNIIKRESEARKEVHIEKMAKESPPVRNDSRSKPKLATPDLFPHIPREGNFR